MARKLLIENIMNLASKLGANPNKYMGTKTNINFLGTGDKAMKGTTFSGPIDESLIGYDGYFGKGDLLKIIEADMGYVTAGKLNDVQLKLMENNLKTIDRVFNPPPGPLNVIDLETGTGALNKEGLESLRDTDKIQRFTQGLRTSKTAMADKIKQGIEGLKTKFGKGNPAFNEAADDLGKFMEDIPTKARAERDFRNMGAADWTDSIQAEGARRAVVREAIKNNPQVFNLPPEMVESIVLSKDLGKGGSKFVDPLVVFRNIGQFTNDELAKIDDIIERSPFDDTKFMSEKVMEYITDIRPEGFLPQFAEGGRIGYRSGGLGRLFSKGIKTSIKRARDAYDSPGVDFQILTQGDSYLMSPPNMQMLEKLKIIRRQLVRDIKRKEGGGKYTHGPDPKGTKKDLDALDDYIADLKKKISIEGYYGEGAEAEKALLKKKPSLSFSQLVKDRYRSAEGGRIGYRSGRSVKGIAELLKLTNKKFGKDTLKIADEIERPASAKLGDEFAAFNERTSVDKGAFSKSNIEDALGLKQYGGIENAKIPLELITADVLKVKYPGITDRLAKLIGEDTNLQRKAEAIAAIDQAMALRGAGKSADETIEILKRESTTKMSKGGLARILEM
jgi:hypothetical protein